MTEDEEKRLKNLELEVRLLREAISILIDQDLDVLTIVKSNDKSDLKKAFEGFRGNVKKIGKFIMYNREIGQIPDSEEDENGR